MGRGEVRARGKQGRIAVPAMPRPMAILCCVLNFIVPGLGKSYVSLILDWLSLSLSVQLHNCMEELYLSSAMWNFKGIW